MSCAIRDFDWSPGTLSVATHETIETKPSIEHPKLMSTAIKSIYTIPKLNAVMQRCSSFSVHDPAPAVASFEVFAFVLAYVRQFL